MNKIALLLTLLASLLGAKDFQLLYPHNQTLCVEGSLCPILWRSDWKGTLCIEAAIGGHDKGLLNDCQTPVGSGLYLWEIPERFVSGFGPEGSRDVRLAFYPAGHPEQMIFSPPFTVMRPGACHTNF
ncbi:hypothetical protein [Nitratifractor sp.]